MKSLAASRRCEGVCAMALVCAAIACVTGVHTLGAQQQPNPEAQAEQQQLQKRFAYPVVRDQRGAIPPGPRPLPAPPLADGPWVWPTMEQRDIKVSVVTRVVLRGASLSLRTAACSSPRDRAAADLAQWRARSESRRRRAKVLSRATMAGLMDIALHPDFAQNKWIYISYHKPLSRCRVERSSAQDLGCPALTM